MIKLEYVDCGKDIQVFLRGTSHEETEQNFWSLYHWRATENPEPNWLDEFQCYFWTQKDRLLSALESSAVGYLLNNRPERFKTEEEALPLARRLAVRRLENATRLPYKKTQVDILNLDCYGIGTIKAENLDSDS